MAKIDLADGRRIPMVNPTLWDSAEVEKEMGWTRKEYADWMKLASMQTALSLFASLRRAGLPNVTFNDCAELESIVNIVAEPGDLARAAAAEAESEGEQEPDPQ